MLAVTPRRTYAESVAGISASPGDQGTDPCDPADVYAEIEAEEDDDPLCPTIRLTKEEVEKIRAPWRKTLIVKVLGRKVGYAYMMRGLSAMWKPKGSLDLIALDKDYYLVRFGSVDDLEYAMYEGPWMVMDHYLIVKPREPDFDPMNDTTEKILVWVRIPCILVEYNDIIFLRKLGNRIGRTVRVDQATSLVSRGKFARICVETDMRKPLISKFTYEKKARHVAYEGMHMVCFECGLYGHSNETCPRLRKEMAEQAPETEKEADIQSTKKAITAAKDPKIPFSTWMIAPKRGGKPQMVTSGQNEGDVEGILHGDVAEPEVAENYGQERPAGASERVNERGTRQLAVGGERGRRPNVVTSEKQIANDPVVAQGVQQNVEDSRPRIRRESGGSLRRAAEEDEHVVVRGERGGLVIRSSRVYVGDTGGDVPSPVWQPTKEHHSDPPGNFDDEGDVVMDLEDGLAQHGIGGNGGTQVQVVTQNQPPWFLAAVYGSPTHHLRRRLWTDLRQSNLGINGPWLIAEDFNTVLNREETSNYSSFSSHHSSDFANWIQDEGLIDMGFTGPKLTWVKDGTNETLKGAKLDRAMCNTEWRLRFPGACVTHLARVASDHAPLFIQVQGRRQAKEPAPFIFQAVRLTHSDLHGLVERFWRHNLSVPENARLLATELTTWNKVFFGCVFKSKRSIIARLNGIQKAMALNYHKGLAKLDLKLRETLADILH
ncbi:PREDICTED: uncharacterized protein LOC109146841 [Ipomoea nil]|uniref:uncharacterized protein LOC109146841 n=1 Tax=Ipomoea nil TaxID=35883 RepID=UPI000901704B|nr:PREDICTED: uncharacterized protein LOC109146841 [Ipomoea nil]